MINPICQIDWCHVSVQKSIWKMAVVSSIIGGFLCGLYTFLPDIEQLEDSKPTAMTYLWVAGISLSLMVLVSGLTVRRRFFSCSFISKQWLLMTRGTTGILALSYSSHCWLERFRAFDSVGAERFSYFAFFLWWTFKDFRTARGSALKSPFTHWQLSCLFWWCYQWPLRF